MTILNKDLEASCFCWRWPTPREVGFRFSKLTPDRLNTLDKNSIIYISGPVTGIPDLNRPVFEEAASMLLAAGYPLFNPSHIEPPKTELKGDDLWRYYMHHCITALPSCGAILMLPNWQNSKGAVWEHRIAEMLGLTILYSPVPDHNP
jgi:hypothetical protein